MADVFDHEQASTVNRDPRAVARQHLLGLTPAEKEALGVIAIEVERF